MTNVENTAKRGDGFFFSLEGSEGCGKSTQITMLRSFLSAKGVEPVMVREPGGTDLGEKIRHLLQHDEAGEGMSAEAELLLFAASRAQLMRELIFPELAAGRLVVADRFLDSTTVYQGIARGLDASAVQAINGFATANRKPDLTILLDVELEVGRARAAGRVGDPDRMEREPDAFFERVRDGYLQLAAAEPERIVVIDASLDPDAVHAQITQVLTERFYGLHR